MSITLYSRFRRQNLRRAWHFSGMTEWCASVGKYIAAFIACLLFAQFITDRAIAEDEALAAKHRAERMAEQAESTWLSCLNNRGVYLDGKLHTCTLANTHFTKGDFK